MRRILCVLCACACADSAAAALLFYDGFDYTVSQRMAPTNDAPATPNPGQHNVEYNVDWRYAGAGLATNEAPLVGSDNLSIAGLKSSTGNSVLYDLTDNGIARVEIPGGPITSGTVYWSGILRVTNVAELDPTTTGGGGGIFVAAFNNGTGPQTSLPTLFAGHLAITKSTTDSSQYFIGSGPNNNSRVFALGSPQDDGDNVFVVVAYSKNPDLTDDTVSLWLNPDPSTFGSNAAPAPLVTAGIATGNEVSSATSFALRNVLDNTGADPTIQLDELRIGMTWADVTPIPEPTSLAILFVTFAIVSLWSRMNA